MNDKEIISELQTKISIYEEIIKKSTFAPLINERMFYSEDYVQKLKDKLCDSEYRRKRAVEILDDNRLLLNKGALYEKGVYRTLMDLLKGSDNNE